MAKLIVVEGPDLGNEYDLPTSAVDPASDAVASPVVLGRDPRATVSLADGAVSREHCKVESRPRGFRLIDLRSRNRTFVNGDPVEEVWLRDGDVVRIGDTELKFVEDAPRILASNVETTIVREIGVRRKAVHATETPAVDAPGVHAGASRTPPASGMTQLHRILSALRESVGSAPAGEVVTRFLAETSRVLSADYAAFLVREGPSWAVRAHATKGDAADAGSQPCLEVVERAASEEKAILSALTAPAGSSLRPSGAGDEPSTSALAAPMLRGDSVGGVLYLERRHPSPHFSAVDLELLRAAAEPASLVLDRLGAEVRLLDENRNLIRTLTGGCRIIGASEGIRGVLDFIQRAAPTAMTVLIQGETGTGKELVASAIHYASPRRGRPFVAINCAALPENLVESELFGHERGAFTGAVARRKGRFELADGGTVLLDEVGELSPTCQAKLLRLLEERRFERVGGAEAVKVDVRVIAATNKDLHEALAAGQFRADLFYRLSVLNVQIPPLRERPEDIPLLVDHFLSAQVAAGGPRKLSKAAERRLLAYAWPGNVRQLRNVIESALVLGKEKEVQPEDLVLPERGILAGAAQGSSSWQPISLEELERSHVLKVLEFTRGNKKRAAEFLGIERCTLYSKLRSYEALEGGEAPRRKP
jgi:Nif-specific regulatory protein